MSHCRTSRVLPWLCGGLSLVAFWAAITAAATTLTEEEFVGPFPSWANVKTQFGAVGDGMSDDTAALQRALNALGSQGVSVVYLPAGTYRITRALVLASRIHVSIIGEDPATTKILWDGVAAPTEGSVMLWLNGVAYSRVNRLTFDGRGRAQIAVWQAWDGSGSYFDTGNEYADNVFQDVWVGLDGGLLGHGFAETTVLRSKFLRNSQAGIITRNFNALDLWVWYSVFEDCAKGITNNPGAGNWRVYHSLFKNSTFADLEIGNTGLFSARHNTSINAKRFLFAAWTENPAQISLQGNVILDPVETTAIDISNHGPLLLLDNTIRSRDGASSTVVRMSHWQSDTIAIGNTFTVGGNPVHIEGRGMYFDDSIVGRASLSALGEPTRPGTPIFLNRQVFEVQAGADAAAIQSAINQAATRTGNRPVVHLPTGTYAIDATLTIPESSDLQLVGDGYSTILQWAGSGAGPVIFIEGPTKATLRDLQVHAKGAKGIVADGVDQPSSRIFMDQAQLLHSTEHHLFVDGLDHTNVDLRNINNAFMTSGLAVKVAGSPLAAAGTASGGKTNLFSGASAGNRVGFTVVRGGRLLVRDVWNDLDSSSSGFIDLSDSGTLTVDNTFVATAVNRTLPAVRIDGFNGKVTVLEVALWDRIVVSGDGSQTDVLGLGMLGGTGARTPYFLNSSSPPADARLLNSRYASTSGGTGSVQAPDIGSADVGFIRDMLAHTRGEVPEILTPLPSGVTDLRFFRVWVDSATVAVHLVGGEPEAPNVVFEDDFTVAVRTPLDAYGAPDYAYNIGRGSQLLVKAATDRVHVRVAGSPAIARILDPSVPTGDQEIIADVRVGTGWDSGWLAVRCAMDGSKHFYAAAVEPGQPNEVVIYRRDWKNWSELVRAHRGIQENTTVRMRLKATGTNPVRIEVQINDTAPVIVSDASPRRKTAGPPGIGGYNDTANAVWVDNVVVTDPTF